MKKLLNDDCIFVFSLLKGSLSAKTADLGVVTVTIAQTVSASGFTF